MVVEKTGFIASSVGDLGDPCFCGLYEILVGRLLYDVCGGYLGGNIFAVEGSGEGFVLKEGVG